MNLRNFAHLNAIRYHNFHGRVQQKFVAEFFKRQDVLADIILTLNPEIEMDYGVNIIND